MKEKKIEQILKDYKLSQTKIRKKILACFLKTNKALSILDFKKEDFFSDFDESSFYRTLDKFKEKRIIQSIPGENNHQLYKLLYGQDHHQHFITCKKCSHKSFLDICSLDSIFNDMAKKKGFHNITHKIELAGLCVSCQY